MPIMPITAAIANANERLLSAVYTTNCCIYGWWLFCWCVTPIADQQISLSIDHQHQHHGRWCWCWCSILFTHPKFRSHCRWALSGRRVFFLTCCHKYHHQHRNTEPLELKIIASHRPLYSMTTLKTLYSTSVFWLLSFDHTLPRFSCATIKLFT